MRIGVDARLYYYQPAGIGLYTSRLLSALATIDRGERQHDYVVLQSRKDSTTMAAGPRFHRRSLWTPPHHRWEQSLLPLELAPLGLDLLHSPDFIPPFGWHGRSVITVMDLAFLRFPHLLTNESRRYYGQVDRAVNRADAILAISESTRNDLVTMLRTPAAKITVTHLAADPACQPVTEPASLDDMRHRYNLPAGYVLFVGTLEPRKDLPTLLRAFASLGPSAKEICLALAGRPGWLYEQVYELAESLGLGDRVRFLGGVPAADLPALYSGAKVFVLPSLYEGFGMPVLEAMACGAPVVCANTTSLPEIAGDAALLFPPGDESALAQAITSLLMDSELSSLLKRRGFAQAARFSWETTARQTLAVYSGLAASRTDPPRVSLPSCLPVTLPATNEHKRRL
jgi:glycosyltransferase involved in cell wall biosynthesis